ncbi:LuxR C-terminal-related transcriptional regulator [Phaeobacter sp. HF9A]|uniref:helix-turn-helix transcriptional regulator n=1 Tax=Phaeobacter sp. HF9A TaxID=2721561 RepID=UPI0014313B8B|nr:LuxR C-terminal-related transcriptional regulator [Phaeobacter sp. HF9A]NIZ12992.1 response regulator transcription factor [Phaeobacter sp. HF9A]
MESEIPPHMSELMELLPNDALSRLVEELAMLGAQAGNLDFPQKVADWVRRWVPTQSISLFEFEEGMQPRTLYAHSLHHDPNMVEYSNGIYLLDPMYSLFAEERYFGTVLLDLTGNETREMPETFARYWIKVSASHEIGTLMEVTPDRCVHLSIYVSLGDRIQEAVNFVKLVHPVLTTAFRRHLRPQVAPDTSAEVARRRVHEAISTVMSEFGAGVLTEREREISRLLLKGHSSKSIARLLDIAPGTAAIHRSNIYRKLGVVGQGEMFSMFIARLIDGK